MASLSESASASVASDEPLVECDICDEMAKETGFCDMPGCRNYTLCSDCWTFGVDEEHQVCRECDAVCGVSAKNEKIEGLRSTLRLLNCQSMRKSARIKELELQLAELQLAAAPAAGGAGSATPSATGISVTMSVHGLNAPEPGKNFIPKECMVYRVIDEAGPITIVPVMRTAAIHDATNYVAAQLGLRICDLSVKEDHSLNGSRKSSLESKRNNYLVPRADGSWMQGEKVADTGSNYAGKVYTGPKFVVIRQKHEGDPEMKRVFKFLPAESDVPMYEP